MLKILFIEELIFFKVYYIIRSMHSFFFRLMTYQFIPNNLYNFIVKFGFDLLKTVNFSANFQSCHVIKIYIYTLPWTLACNVIFFKCMYWMKYEAYACKNASMQNLNVNETIFYFFLPHVRPCDYKLYEQGQSE